MKCCKYCHNSEVGACVKYWCDCHSSTPTPKPAWEERFDREFVFSKNGMSILTVTATPEIVKAFIQETLASQRDELRKKIDMPDGPTIDPDNTPEANAFIKGILEERRRILSSLDSQDKPTNETT